MEQDKLGGECIRKEVPSDRWEGSGMLKRSLRLLYVYALATGAIFTFIGYWDGIFLSVCGPATWIAFGLMTLLILPIAFVYCELAAMLPTCGAELVYGTIGLNKHFGYWSCWLILLAWIAVPPAAVMGILEWLNYQFNLGISGWTLTVVGCIILCIYCGLSLYEIKLAGEIQTVMLFLAIFGCLLTGVLFFFSGHWSLANYANHFQNNGGGIGGVTGWLLGLSIIITPYFGFETVPNLVEEGTFPIKSMSKAIWGSVVTCGLVYMFIYFFAAGIAPWSELTNNGSMEPFVMLKQMNSWGWTGYGLFFGITTIFFSISTCLLGFWISSVRLMYAMGRQNFLPKSFARTNKHAQPIVPNLLILVIGLFFLLFKESSYVADFYTLMAFACASCYTVIMVAAIRLAIRHPEWERPYVLRGGQAFRGLAFIIALVITIGCIFSLNWSAVKTLIYYLCLGAVLWLWMIFFKWPKQKVWMSTPDGEKDF